jgi:hypothetical protein
MSILLKIFRLAAISGFLAGSIIATAPSASAFSLNPIKAAKSIGKAAGSAAKGVGKAAGGVAKGVGKAAGGAVKVVGNVAANTSGKIAMGAIRTGQKTVKVTGRAVLNGGKNLGKGIKTAANGAKKPLGVIGHNALLATPAAPAIMAKRAVDTARHGPRASSFMPTPIRR